MWAENSECSWRQIEQESLLGDCGPGHSEHAECTGRQVGDKWRQVGDKCEIMQAENPECSGRQLGDKWETSEHSEHPECTGDKWAQVGKNPVSLAGKQARRQT